MEPGVLAVLSGVMTGLIGAVAYFLVPLVTSEYVNTGGRDSLEITYYILESFFEQSVYYHVGVLVLVPLVITVLTLSLVRRGGHAGRSTDVAVVTTVIVGPFVTVLLGAAIAWGAIAVQSPAIAILGIIFALPIAVIFSACVAIVTAVSAVGGYALVKRFGPRSPD
ncbi:hypothetical protein NDI54_12165 [Haloarcula sp. S1AR25-5A]|uniref:Uncharacterized protein n=1 Tax=Haloarcula terrestris TaxID=2950533 RepID=A0AAE4EZ46_9EURY|nr:hypothetical protein [Haloarcula terrestris]MDS0222104.1 hypothetical protein [Haloarcula terrestris]